MEFSTTYLSIITHLHILCLIAETSGFTLFTMAANVMIPDMMGIVDASLS